MTPTRQPSEPAGADSPRQAHMDVRETIVATMIVGGVCITVVTESLSALERLTFWWLLVVWAIIAAAGALLAVRSIGRPRLPRTVPRAPGLEAVMAAWIVVVALGTGATALCAIPTTYDSMTYHLARVAHWAENHTVAFYPTAIMRQLHPPPWAEYAMLQLYVLAGGDRLVNLVEWLAMAGSVLGTSLIARQLGATGRGQMLAAFVCATIPMGLLQASSTQNDYVAALWLVCLVHALLVLQSRGGLVPMMAAGLSLGLALSTKGTAYIFALPFLVGFLLWPLDPSPLARYRKAAVILACALALNAPHYARNLDLFGSMLGPGGEGREYEYVNRAFTPAIFVSNVLRNVGLHLGTPWPDVNAATERAITRLHATMGIALDDPRSTWPFTRFAVVAPSAHEDLAGNGLHLVLIVAALGVVAFVSRVRTGDRVTRYAACLVLAFFLFCLVLRWQIWHSRLQLPLFVLGAPLVGAVLQRLDAKLLAVPLLLLAAGSADVVASNETRPLIGPSSVLKTSRLDQRAARYPDYLGASRVVRSTECLQVGLAMGENELEYPIWPLLPEARRSGRLEHLVVLNESRYFAEPRAGAFRPCAVIRVADAPRSTVTFSGQSYQSAWSQGRVQVLLPSAAADRGSTSAPGPQVIRLTVNGARFRAGDRVMVGLEAHNPPGNEAADLYVALLLPDGKSAVFVSGAGVLSAVTSLASPAAFPRAQPAPPGFSLTDPAFFAFTFPDGAARGTYRVSASLVREGAFRDDRVHPEDVLISDTKEFLFSP